MKEREEERKEQGQEADRKPPCYLLSPGLSPGLQDSLMVLEHKVMRDEKEMLPKIYLLERRKNTESSDTKCLTREGTTTALKTSAQEREEEEKEFVVLVCCCGFALGGLL